MKFFPKNPFENATDRELRGGLVFGIIIFVLWLLMVIFVGKERSFWVDWIFRGWTIFLFVYCFYESLREMKRRRRKP
ncbi:MAG TPA: hypothetical protein VGO57_11865 [Verrucomicrobiae bacterium]|jgi:hypothetical protein